LAVLLQIPVQQLDIQEQKKLPRINLPNIAAGLPADILSRRPDLKAAELRLRVREDEDKVFAELLKARGLVTKTPAEIKEVERQLAEALEDNQDAIDGAVQAKATELTVAAAAKLAAIEANHKVEIAQLNANASADKRTIESQVEQIAQLRGDLAEERKARVQTEEARSRAAGVTVQTSAK
jgi:hypothetical protein